MVNQSDRTGEKPAGGFFGRCLPVEHEFIAARIWLLLMVQPLVRCFPSPAHRGWLPSHGFSNTSSVSLLLV